MARPNLKAVRGGNSALPPCDISAEQALLGAVLAFGVEAFERVQAIIKPADFYRDNHRRIFQSMAEIHAAGRPIDLVTTKDQLRENGELDRIGGHAYLAELADATGTAANIGHYAGIIAKKVRLRGVLGLCQKAVEKVQDLKADPLEIVHGLAGDLGGLIEDSAETGFLSAKSLLQTTFEAETPIIGRGILPATGGLIIGADSGVGKSMLRLDLAIHLALGLAWLGLPVPKARKVLIVQIENTLRTEKVRLERMLKGLGLGGPPTGLTWGPPERFDLSLKKDRARLEGLVKRSGCDVVVFDPLSSFHSGNENDSVQMRQVLDTFTEIGRKCGSATVLIHHHRKPGLDDNGSGAYMLRGASGIKDWCDTLLTLTPKNHERRVLRLIDFHKVRNGAVPAPILIERDENFVHRPVEPDVLCPPSRVKEILEGLGGQIDGQGGLIEAIRDEVGCGQRAAKGHIKTALQMGAIFARSSEGHAQRQVYSTE